MTMNDGFMTTMITCIPYLLITPILILLFLCILWNF